MIGSKRLDSEHSKIETGKVEPSISLALSALVLALPAISLLLQKSRYSSYNLYFQYRNYQSIWSCYCYTNIDVSVVNDFIAWNFCGCFFIPCSLLMTISLKNTLVSGFHLFLLRWLYPFQFRQVIMRCSEFSANLFAMMFLIWGLGFAIFTWRKRYGIWLRQMLLFGVWIGRLRQVVQKADGFQHLSSTILPFSPKPLIRSEIDSFIFEQFF